MTPSQKKEIEERFQDVCVGANGEMIRFVPMVKSFLFSTLDQALAAQKEEIRKDIEKLRENADKEIEPDVYHQALSDLLNSEVLK